MAALRPCTSGLVVALSISSPPPLSSFRRPVPGLVNHRLSAVQHLHHRRAISAHKNVVDWPFGLDDPDGYKPMTNEQIKNFHEQLKKDWDLNMDMSFKDEMETIDELWKKMTSWNTSIFHVDATMLSMLLCLIAKGGVKLASKIIVSATLRPEGQDKISLCRTKQTLATFVSIFAMLAEDTYNMRFRHTSLFSLLGAFRGVAATSHILLNDSLESINYAEHSSSSYSLLVQETNDIWQDYEQNMKILEDKFSAASSNNSKANDLLRPTMEKAIIITIFFVSTMEARHKRVLLGHISVESCPEALKRVSE